MSIFKILKFLATSKHVHFISVDFSTYKRWKLLIKMVVKLNKNYIGCEIFRKKYKTQRNLVVVGLRYYGKNVKRRVNGYAKEQIKDIDTNCIYCNRKLTEKNATADHIIPISLGGNNTQVNLITCCVRCNGDRGNKNFRTFLSEKNINFRNVKYPFI